MIFNTRSQIVSPRLVDFTKQIRPTFAFGYVDTNENHDIDSLCTENQDYICMDLHSPENEKSNYILCLTG